MYIYICIEMYPFISMDINVCPCNLPMSWWLLACWRDGFRHDWGMDLVKTSNALALCNNVQAQGLQNYALLEPWLFFLTNHLSSLPWSAAASFDYEWTGPYCFGWWTEADEFDSVSPGMDWKTRMYQIDVSLMLNLSRGECTLVSRCHLACAGLNWY